MANPTTVAALDASVIQRRKTILRRLASAWGVQFFTIVGYAIVLPLAGVIALELLLWIAWSIQSLRLPNLPQIQASSPVYSHQDWSSQFWKEEMLRKKLRRDYRPFEVWGNTPLHGEYINNDKRQFGVVRRTVGPPSAECAQRQQVRVWLFGGSVAYGLGVPDWATPASFLSRDLSSALRKCVSVVNFGVEGYVSNQETILLMERLKAGPAPDMVVFYDGANDTSAVLRPEDPAHSHFSLGTVKARVEGSLSGRLDFIEGTYTVRSARMFWALLRGRTRSLVNTPVVNHLPTTAAAVMDNYEGNIRLGKALANAYNFKLYWFWQPSLYFGRKPLVPFEQKLANVEDVWAVADRAVYQEAARRAAQDGEFIFLGDLFDQATEPIYIDQVHTGPQGNELAAAAIANHIVQHP